MRERRELARRAAIRVLSITRLSRRRRNGHRKLLVVAISLLGTLSLSTAAEAVDRYQTYTRDLPDPQSLSTKELAQATKIYDRNGTLLYVKHTAGVIRTVIPLAQISSHLVHATVAVEDRGFYTHHGVDFRRIVAAAIADVTHQRIQQGASTITEQLVKMSFLTSQNGFVARTFERKIREAVLAIEIERRFTKNDILTMYLNQIFYGHQAYGAEAAAQTYFAKPAKDLDIGEAAMLAGIPNAPSAFDPLNPQTAQNARDRQVVVLDAMLRDSYISDAQYAAALKETLKFQNGTIQKDVKAPWFVDYVLQVLDQQYGVDVVNAGGLRVTTTLDYGLQQITENAVATEVNKPNLRARNVNNGAAEVIDPATGQVLAMVGSANYYDVGIGGQYNVITGHPGRQPGSSFKIYDYATAFSNGYTPATLINDTQGKIDGHPFVDWDHRSEGLITLRQALEESRNIPAIQLFKQLRYDRVFQTARMMGLTSANLTPVNGLAQAIGSDEVVPMEHFNAYAVLAAGGIYHAPAVILKVEDSEGRVLQQWQPSLGTRVLSPQVAYMINDILRPVGADLHITRPFASKTGTTENWNDSWLIGYNPDIVIGAWMGHTCAGACAGNHNLNVVWGVMGAGQIFRDVFNAYEAAKPVHDFVVPDGLRKATVCRASTLLATPACAGQTVTDWFIAGTVPARPDDWYRQVRVCTTDGLLATPDVPSNLTTLRTYVFYPAGFPDAMKDPHAVQPPTQSCGVLTETIPPTLSLTWTTNSDGTATITAEAQDDQAVKQVDFYLDGTLIQAVTQAPYTIKLGTPGIHQVKAMAYDYNPANAAAVQSVTVTIAAYPSPSPTTSP